LLPQIERWLRAELDEHTFETIMNRLGEIGHGASAYIIVYWDGGGAHAFNAVNRHGNVYWVDAQDGPLVAPWPPRRFPYPLGGYDETDVDRVFAALRSLDGSST
jgi:hypothetical protein